ncbi:MULTISPECIES: hypothetical protein [unclassified Burkholderia]|uniref:hypothetical protein n=1 Tax=unclassified Burkholderia TaxID=2613784 RepID=UPI002AAF2C4C|nr:MULTISPECIES: hypothetical protein [unclassified Burkholderia]
MAKWTLYQAIEQIAGALPDAPRGPEYGIDRTDIDRIQEVVRKGEEQLDELTGINLVWLGINVVPKAWPDPKDPIDPEFIESLYATRSAAVAHALERVHGEFSPDLADLLWVEGHNTPRTGRPMNTEFYRFDGAKGWHYLTSEGRDTLLHAVQADPDRIRTYYRTEELIYSRFDEQTSPFHRTWKFLAEAAGVPVLEPDQAEQPDGQSFSTRA